MTQQIILHDGTLVSVQEWQAMNGLEGMQLSKNFCIEELEDRYWEGKKELKPKEGNGELIISGLLLDLLQEFRNRLEAPVKINSGYRTDAHQRHLQGTNAGAAKNSPHPKGMAADIDTVSNKQTEQYVKLLREIGKDMDLDIRIGWKQYEGLKETFVHVDVCPEYYAKGMPWHSKAHPWQWEQKIEW